MTLSELAAWTGGVEVSTPQDFIKHGGHAWRAGASLLCALIAIRLALSSRPWSRRGSEPRRIRRSSGEDPASLLAAAGDALGQPTTVGKVGPFAGFRSIEPGDRLGDAVTEQILLMSTGTDVIPQVARRVRELTVAVNLVINCGSSMRPTARGRGKLGFAIQVAELLAAAAWRGGGAVTVQLVGLEGDDPWSAPIYGGSGAEIRSFVLDAIDRRRSTTIRKMPLRARGPALSSVEILLSDFAYEDFNELRRDLQEYETDERAVAVIAITDEEDIRATGWRRYIDEYFVVDRSVDSEADLRGERARTMKELERLVRSSSGLFVKLDESLGMSANLVIYLRDSGVLALFM